MAPRRGSKRCGTIGKNCANIQIRIEKCALLIDLAIWCALRLTQKLERGIILANWLVTTEWLAQHINAPDVVVMDVRLPGGSGIEACEKIINKFPDTKVIMLTSYAEDEMLFSAIRAGASGYILKQVGSNELIDAIEAVGRGDALLDPAVTQRVFKEVRKAAREEEASAFTDLTDQEKHVLIHVSEGKTNREIAKTLYLGEGTVRNYVSSILSKLDVSNRAEAAAYAVKHNLRNHLVHLTKD